MTPALKAKLLKAFAASRWRDAGDDAVAKHFKTTRKAVRRLRLEHGFAPARITTRSGRVIRRGGIGRRKKTLNARQQALVAQMAEMAETLAFKNANRILSKDDLHGVANDALVVAARYWDKAKQAGTEKEPGSKWRGYAALGIFRAFNRAFKKRRAELRRTAVFGSHPYQQWLVGQRLTANDRAAVAGQDLPARPEPGTLFARFQRLTGQDRMIIECVSGLDGRPPWKTEDVAEFWQVSFGEAQRMIERAKEALLAA